MAKNVPVKKPKVMIKYLRVRNCQKYRELIFFINLTILSAKVECQNIPRQVAKQVPVENCHNVPKEECKKVIFPRMIEKAACNSHIR